MKYAFVSTENSVSNEIFKKITSSSSSGVWTFIKTKDELVSLDRYKHVFVFRWPHLIKDVLSASFIGFHTSNLPEGRGGSPLQNQIMEGIVQTKVNALKLTDVVDGGPVYSSKVITLQGTIEDVWRTIGDTVVSMINEIIEKDPTPEPQHPSSGKTYKRRTNNSIEQTKDINELYRFIQMLDGEGYPNAYLEFNGYRLELSRASLRNGTIVCDAKITSTEKK